jgi:RNA polymerase sigma-70 factor (ECF subfamily)
MLVNKLQAGYFNFPIQISYHFEAVFKNLTTMNSQKQELDTELIRSFQKGNQQALETLVNRHKEKIFSTIFFLVKDKQLAEDLFQEVFFKIIDTLLNNRYKEEGKFIQWALRISHNLCVDHFRKMKCVTIISSGDNKDIFDTINVNNEESAADTSLIQSQSHDKIRCMLQHLPEEQRFKEIAEITNTSINTALGRMRYGLINLRKMMAENQIVL